MRQCTFRYGMLMEMEQCHLIDTYTQLPMKFKEFQSDIGNHPQVALHFMPTSTASEASEALSEDQPNVGDLAKKALIAALSKGTPTVYDIAKDICSRTGKRWMVAGCLVTPPVKCFFDICS